MPRKRCSQFYDALTKRNRNLKTPFKIKFCKEVTEPSNEIILNNFRKKFEDTYCDSIEVLDNNKIIVRNEIVRMKPDLNWNLWSGIGYAELTIIESHENETKRVEYVIDLTRISITSILLISFIIFIMVANLSLDELFKFLKVILLFIIPLLIISHLIIIFRHRFTFFKTFYSTSENIGNYNWKEILESKTKHELIEISSGKTQLPNAVIELAKIELAKRI